MEASWEVCHTEEDLWSAVPQCDHLMGVGVQGHLEGSSKPKISQLDRLPISRDEQVLQTPPNDVDRAQHTL